MTSTILTKVKSVTPAGWFNLTMLAIFTILLGIFLSVMPKCTDDYWFMSELSGWYHSQDIPDASDGGNIFKAGIPWDDIIYTIQLHWIYDNSRLSNMLVMPALLLPKWLGSLFVLICWLWAVKLSFKLANIQLSSPLISVGVVMWLLFIPWYNQMGSLVFQFNYILPTAVSLTLITFLKINKEPAPDTGNSIIKKKKLLQILGGGVLGLISGWFHEGFSLPILIGILTLMAIDKGYRNPKYYSAVIGLIIGLLIIFLAKGLLVRLGVFKEISHSFLQSIPYLIVQNIPYYIFLILIFIVNAKGNLIKFLRTHKLVLFGVISGFIPMVITLRTFNEGRVTWWTQVISIICILYLCRLRWSRYWDKYTGKLLIWFVPCLLFSLIHFTVADYYVIKINRYYKKGIRDYIANPDKTVFGDVVTSDDLPLICVRMPDIVSDYYFNLMGKFLSAWSGKSDFAVIPLQLRNASQNSGKSLEGNLNARIIDNKIGESLRNYPCH